MPNPNQTVDELLEELEEEYADVRDQCTRLLHTINTIRGALGREPLDPTAARTEYNQFIAGKMSAGMSMKEAAAAWSERKKAAGPDLDVEDPPSA